MTQFRDPIHDWIICSKEETELINSPLVQRLKWVMQLSAVYHIFSGGTHTRFSHSLGAMHIAGKYLKHLLKNPELRAVCIKHPPEHYIQVARVAGLLHDIGHGPFSHVFDRAVYKKLYNQDHGHDLARLTMIDHELLKPYIVACGVDPEELKLVWTEKINPSGQAAGLEDQLYLIISAVVQGPLGADRIDFTLRDSYFTGTTHLGTIAHQRIVSNSSVTVTKSQLILCYDFKCIRDIISALDGRLYLYHDVYFHRISMAASLVISEMLENNVDSLGLIEKTKDLNQFKKLTDDYILGRLSDDPWCTRLLERRLPKLVHEKMVNADDHYSEQEYIDVWCDGELKPGQHLVRTRVINGISPRKFEQYHIKFKHKLGLVSCSDALLAIKYTNPQPPYYLVRLFSDQHQIGQENDEHPE